MWRIGVWLLSAAILVVPPSAWAEVGATKHNLSSTGAGSIRAVSQQWQCGFCHSPYSPQPYNPLWNHEVSAASVIPYASTTIEGSPAPALSGSSFLCQSCHDGTVRLGSVAMLDGGPGEVAMLGVSPNGKLPPGPSLVGTDLRNDHPVSLPWTPSLLASDPDLNADGGADELLRRANGILSDNVQCSSCHNPHGTDQPKLLVVGSERGRLCLRCHAKVGWEGSSHQVSETVVPGGGQTVAQAACLSCHQVHGAPTGAPHLLKNGADAGVSLLEETCFRCHQSAAKGGVAADIRSDFSKTSHHPVVGLGGHEPVSTLASSPEPVLNSSRHVECQDCHNPHRVRAGDAFAGMRGISLEGGIVDGMAAPARGVDEHEVCLRCHGDSVASVLNVPTASGLIPGNKRLEFDPANSAFHPVGRQGRNQSANLAAQLAFAGLTPNSTVLCSDCHNSDSTGSTLGRASNAPDGGPRGLHGSSNPALLRANYRLTYTMDGGPTVYNSNDAALCFLCHDETKLMADTWDNGARTNFYYTASNRNQHWVHMVREAGSTRATCRNCHFNTHSNQAPPNTIYEIEYPTGVVLDFEQPQRDVGSHLVNFSPDMQPIGTAKPIWRFRVSDKFRTCVVSCHGHPMAWGYRPPSGDVTN